MRSIIVFFVLIFISFNCFSQEISVKYLNIKSLDTSNLNSNSFWDSCWIVFFVNAVVSILASYGIKANLDGDFQSGILPRLLLITVIDICLFSILVNTIFEKIGKGNAFYKFIIPFNWIQSFQAILMLSFAILGLILPPSIFVFFGIGVVIWVTFSLWRIGKEEVGLSGWGATGMIFLSVVIEASLGMFSRSLSMTM